MAGMKSIAAKMMALIGAGTMFCAAGSTTAHAQFQTVFGAAQNDGAEGGVVQSANGNFVSVGTSNSFSTTKDVYVVETDRCGRLVRAATYDIGGSDYGIRIRNARDGGYIIVGQTENLRNCCTQWDAFLMKLRQDGSVEWVRTYGGPREENGLDVRVLSDGYIFTGYSESAGAGGRDGWITRTDLNGTIVWSRLYGGAGEDMLQSVGISCGSYVVAAGSTSSHSGGTDNDIYIVRADLSDGAFSWSRHYGGRGDEVARAIETDTHTPEFYVAGSAEVSANTSQGYLMKVECDNGTVLADQTYQAINLTSNGAFTDIDMIPNGNLVLSGYTLAGSGGFGGSDAWLLEVDLNMAVQWSRIYGGARNDQAWAVSGADRDIAPPHSIIMAGSTESFGAGEYDLYKVFTDIDGASGCNDRAIKVQPSGLGLQAERFASAVTSVWLECRSGAEPVFNKRYIRLCTSCLLKNSQESPDLGGARHSGEEPDAMAYRSGLNR